MIYRNYFNPKVKEQSLKISSKLVEFQKLMMEPD